MSRWCTTWTLIKHIEKKLDGHDTRMLRAILNVYWSPHHTKQLLYNHLPPIRKTIQDRQTRHVGHCWRNRDELISDVLQWNPIHGRAKAGRPARTYIQQLSADTGPTYNSSVPIQDLHTTAQCLEDLLEVMDDREGWRERVREIRADGVNWWWCLSLQCNKI